MLTFENLSLPVLFQFEVGDIDRGASLSFLSQYPNEDEILIPPLSYLEVTDEPFLEPTEKGDVWVYPARINCNLKSLVLLRERWKEREREREEGKGERERRQSIVALQSLLSLVGIPGVVGLIALEGLLGV